VSVGAVTTLAALLRSGRIAPALALVGAIVGLSACGSGDDGTIPPDDAESLLTALEQVQQDVDNGDCSVAQTDATQFVGQVDALPKEVGVEVKNVLREAGENLRDMTGDPDQCKEPDTGPSGDTGFVPTTSTSTTTTTSTEPPEEDQTPPEQPPNEGGSGQEDNPNPGGGTGGDSGGTEG
jgi:hypothetical protein